MFNCVALKSPDVNGIIYELSSAVLLTRMLADHAADSGERIVLTDELNRIIISSFIDESDITRDINMGRALCNAGNGLEALKLTAAVLNVLFKIIPESLDGLDCHSGCLGTDRTVCGTVDGISHLLDLIQIFDSSLTVEHRIDKIL